MSIRFLNNSKGNASTKLNVFVQTQEPEIKEGIWLQTNKTFDKVYFDEQVKKIELENWDNLTEYPSIEQNIVDFPCALVGDYIYIFCNSEAKKYNYKTNEIINLSSTPVSFSKCSACVVGTNIYIGSNSSDSNIYKYDTLTDTCSAISSLSSVKTNHSYGCCTLAVGDYVFFLGGGQNGNKIISKYNTITGEYNKLNITLPYNLNLSWCSPVVVGDQIYIMGFYNNSNNIINNTAYVFDTISETFTKLSDIPTSSNWGGYTACNVDNYIYIFGKESSGSGSSGLKNYKYNISNNTYSSLPNLTSAYRLQGYACSVGNKIILMVNVSSKIKILGFFLAYSAVYNYENNSVVVWDGFGKYKTQLTSHADNQEGEIKTLFYDAYHYTTSNGLDDTIPTYYGNGTQWIKFKN